MPLDSQAENLIFMNGKMKLFLRTVSDSGEDLDKLRGSSYSYD